MQGPLPIAVGHGSYRDHKVQELADISGWLSFKHDLAFVPAPVSDEIIPSWLKNILSVRSTN